MKNIDQEAKLNSVFKVTVIMEILCASPSSLSVREVEERTGIPRSTAHRFLSSLEDQQWVFRDPATEGYRPGIRFFLLSNRSSFYDELVHKAESEMSLLMKATGNTAVLSVTEGTTGLCIHSVEPPSPVKFTANRGMSIPLHAVRRERFCLPTAPRRSVPEHSQPRCGLLWTERK